VEAMARPRELLPEWAQIPGGAARWWSDSQKKYHDVTIHQDDTNRRFKVIFVENKTAYKLVPYSQLVGPEGDKCQLKAPLVAAAAAGAKEAPAASEASAVDAFLKKWNRPITADDSRMVVTRSFNGTVTKSEVRQDKFVLQAKGGAAPHAAVLRDGAQCWIADLGTPDGTYLDEEFLKPFKEVRWTARQTVYLGSKLHQDKLELAITAPDPRRQPQQPSAVVLPRAKPQADPRGSLAAQQPAPQRQQQQPHQQQHPRHSAARLPDPRQQSERPLKRVPSEEAPRYGWEQASTASEPPAKRRYIGEGTSVGGGSSSSAPPAGRAPPGPRAVGPARAAPQPQQGPGRPAAGGKLKCDKCDGPHATSACPHFKKGREDHKDAWQNYGSKKPVGLGATSTRHVCEGREVRQPGDGSCLFHSLTFGLYGRGTDRRAAEALRRELAEYIMRNPKKEISGDTLEEWIRWDANASVQAYARRMAVSGWGGGIEMAACSLMKRVNVHVYERRGRKYERISCFDNPAPQKTIHVLYQGGVHYDALVPAC